MLTPMTLGPTRQITVDKVLLIRVSRSGYFWCRYVVLRGDCICRQLGKETPQMQGASGELNRRRGMPGADQ
jgi:hypothetical protein